MVLSNDTDVTVAVKKNKLNILHLLPTLSIKGFYVVISQKDLETATFYCPQWKFWLSFGSESEEADLQKFPKFFKLLA